MQGVGTFHGMIVDQPCVHHVLGEQGMKSAPTLHEVWLKLGWLTTANCPGAFLNNAAAENQSCPVADHHLCSGRSSLRTQETPSGCHRAESRDPIVGALA